MTTLRKLLFWTHLASGLVAGVVIAIMSATGIAIAFEQEILGYIDRDVSRVEIPPDATRQSLSDLRATLAYERPTFRATSVIVLADPEQALRFQAGRTGTLYVDPYTGAIAEPRAGPAHDILHTLEDWHRWLGQDGESRATGRLITGICNAAFLVLCLTGLYLWWPKALRWPVLRRALWFAKTKTSKARDFNWHNVFAIWSLPVLVVLVTTAIVISFGWAHDLVFRLSGEEPPEFRDFRMMMVPAPVVPTPPPAAELLGEDAIVNRLIAHHPDWRAILFNFPRPTSTPAAPAAPLDITVIEPAPFMTAGRVMLHIDPYTGEELQSTAFADRSPGLRARVWIRFLHTGEAFGLIGKVIATLATAASLVLVYTGFALSWRRFVGPRRSNHAPTTS